MNRTDILEQGREPLAKPRGQRAAPRTRAAPRRTPRRADGDSLDAVFGAGPFNHQIVLSLAWATGILDALAGAVEDAGALLQALNVAEVDGAYSAKIWIKGVSCDAARQLSDRIARLPAVTYAHVEHHLARAPQG